MKRSIIIHSIFILYCLLHNISMAAEQTDACQYNLKDLDIRDGTHYLNGKPITGIACFYNKNGNIFNKTPFKDGKREGLSKNYYDYESGKLLSETLFKDGKIEGLVTYYESGKLRDETPYKDDKREGLGKSYYESGKLEDESPLKDGKREGLVKTYYESGKLRHEKPFKDDKIEGLVKVYNESGKLDGEIHYKNGKKEGQLRFYRENGKLFVILEYKNDSPVSGMCYEDNKEDNWIETLITGYLPGMGRGRPLTNAEITNWKNGSSFECK